MIQETIHNRIVSLDNSPLEDKDDDVTYTLEQIKKVIEIIPIARKLKWNQEWKFTVYHKIESLASLTNIKGSKLLSLVYQDISKKHNIDLSFIKKVLLLKNEYESDMHILDVVGQCAELRESFNKSLNEIIQIYLDNENLSHDNTASTVDYIRLFSYRSQSRQARA